MHRRNMLRREKFRGEEKQKSTLRESKELFNEIQAGKSFCFLFVTSICVTSVHEMSGYHDGWT